jgi:hypothetical protein
MGDVRGLTVRVRISAIHVEDGLPQTDRLIAVVGIAHNRAVSDDECFGVVIDDGERFPFTGKPEREDFVLDYGAYGKGEAISRINIIGKRLKVGSLFTRVDVFRGEPDTDEYTYRIEFIG